MEMVRSTRKSFYGLWKRQAYIRDPLILLRLPKFSFSAVILWISSYGEKDFPDVKVWSEKGVMWVEQMKILCKHTFGVNVFVYLYEIYSANYM